jgi:peptide/nickel transport system ATP-binding protein
MLNAPTQDYTRSLWAVRELEKPEEPADDVILQVRGIDATYGDSVKVLDEVTIDLPRGRTAHSDLV